jgi:hypothetical protein
VGCTGKPYWGATKKACDVDQYGAPPMDGSKDGQAGAPATVPTGATATAAVVQGPAMLTAVPAGVPMTSIASKGPAGVLALAARKGREGKATRRVANNGARYSVCGGANEGAHTGRL